GRLDPPLQRVRGDLPRRGDLPHGRRGAEVPDPRTQRERRPDRDPAPRARRGAVPREVRGGEEMSQAVVPGRVRGTSEHAPAPFPIDDFKGRMARAAQQAKAAGLTGLLVTPGPDLVYFTGYQPTAITERLTMLVIQESRDPAMIVPILERPDAEGAAGAGAAE